jgi:hypothetical protein
VVLVVTETTASVSRETTARLVRVTGLGGKGVVVAADSVSRRFIERLVGVTGLGAKAMVLVESGKTSKTVEMVLIMVVTGEMILFVAVVASGVPSTPGKKRVSVWVMVVKRMEVSKTSEVEIGEIASPLGACRWPCAVESRRIKPTIQSWRFVVMLGVIERFPSEKDNLYSI